ncbi:MAG: transporter [Gammaproteobacteria bacterium]|jgi:hypothetical protein|nr:transporter [Gammaproteobacteria bacterium]
MLRLLLISVVVLCTAPRHAISQELSPRAYWPAPTGTQIMTIGYAFTTGDIIPDPSLPVTGFDSDINAVKIGYLRTLELFGRSSNLQVELPYANGRSSVAGPDDIQIQRDYKGQGDITTTLSINLLGAPAMDAGDFAALRESPRPILGASLKVVAPTGRYDADRLLNVGANRWAAKAELGYMQVLTSKWLLESQAGLWLFADNDDFLGARKEQDPIASVQFHLVRRFSPGFWGSINTSLYRGGRSRVAGVKLDDLQRDMKVGATLAFPVARGHVVRVGYNTGSINDDGETFHELSLAYSRLF